MLGKHQYPNIASGREPVVVGIDVGGIRKGFHAVALKSGKYLEHRTSKDIDSLVNWCRGISAIIVAIDAPCHWSTNGAARPAERELMQKGIWCFSTPTRERARKHPKNHYGWMLRGEELFQALAPSHPIWCGPRTMYETCCIETFPHAVAWQLTEGGAKAEKKLTQRRAILDRAKIDRAVLTNIDLIDAAICALTAHCFYCGWNFASYGEPDTGYIVVPTHLDMPEANMRTEYFG
jgi:predicted nuclease with RNAse H fold